MKVYILLRDVVFVEIIGVFKTLKDARDQQLSMGRLQGEYRIEEHEVIE